MEPRGTGTSRPARLCTNCCEEALDDWKRLADPALEWFATRVLPPVRVITGDREEEVFLPQSAVWADFQIHAKDYNGQPLGRNTFLQRIRAALPDGMFFKHDRKAGDGFAGMRLRPRTVGDFAEGRRA
jgi:hypothetical protein